MTPENTKFKKWEPYEIWGLVNAQNLCEEHNAAISRLDELTAEVARLSAPIAAPDTLEKLAEIGLQTWHDLDVPPPEQELATIPLSPVPTWRDPTQAELDSSLFSAIWNCIKTWDISVPDQYNGYMGAIGNHVTLILDAIRPHIGQRGVAIESITSEQYMIYPDREAVAHALVDAFYQEAPSSHPYTLYTHLHLAQADRVLALFRKLNDGHGGALRCEPTDDFRPISGIEVLFEEAKAEMGEPTEAEIEELAHLLRDTWCATYRLGTATFPLAQGDYAMARAAWAHLKGGA